jgi:hypothetical protein
MRGFQRGQLLECFWKTKALRSEKQNRTACLSVVGFPAFLYQISVLKKRTSHSENLRFRPYQLRRVLWFLGDDKDVIAKSLFFNPAVSADFLTASKREKSPLGDVG